MATSTPTNTSPTDHANLREIVTSKTLSTDEKIALLKERELDLREVLVAADEGMAEGDAPVGDTAEDPGVALRNVHDALESLGAEAEVNASPTKLGG